jgi:hypothetical protein
MSDPQKIWFIYLSDHHEGPFTPAEVGEKLQQGLVNGQSLAWKDGMAEWVALETIPDLQAVMGGAPVAQASPAPAAEAPKGGGEEGFSLAQLLASQQSGGGEAPAIEATQGSAPSIAMDAVAAPEDSSLTGAASVLSSMVSKVNAGASESSNSGINIGGIGPMGTGESPAPDEEVWTLRIGKSVSGLFSLAALREMAAKGEVPADAYLWHPGWSDFQPVAAVKEVASARKAGAKPGATFGKVGGGKGGIAPITSAGASATLGDDQPTDPNIAYNANPKGLTGLLAKFKALFQKSKQAVVKKSSAAAVNPAIAKMAGRSNIGKATGLVATVKKVVLLMVPLLAIGGGGAYWFLFLRSPIPSDLDVLPSDLEKMVEVAKAPAQEGGRFFLALSRGSEDNPADDTNPKFYIATNLPVDTGLSMKVSGKSGTLVNRVTFEKDVKTSVTKQRFATVESIQEDGKPIPMGEYTITISAEGAEPLVLERFLGGKKGGPYQERLKRYQAKLQGEYDKEMEELRQYVETLKTAAADIGKKLADYKAKSVNPQAKASLKYEWDSFSPTASTMISQVDQKIRARPQADANNTVYHPKAFADIQSTAGQMLQLLQAQTAKVAGQVPTSSPDELEGLVQAAVVSLEQFLAGALTKSPLDVLTGAGTKPAEGGTAYGNVQGGEPTTPPTAANPSAPAIPGAAPPAGAQQ